MCLCVHAGFRSKIQRALPYNPTVVEEGGRHWTDDEVRALLCVWADQRIRGRLKCTLRNKSIFQEMARLMQMNFGVVRNWKQCRTKYKNLKYDYKTAKSAHAAGGSSSGSPGKYMKFFDEVEAILLDRGLENGSMEMQKKLYDGELEAGRLQTPAQRTASESEVVIEIDDGVYPLQCALYSLVSKVKIKINSQCFFDYQMTTVMSTTWMETQTRNGEAQVWNFN